MVFTWTSSEACCACAKIVPSIVECVSMHAYVATALVMVVGTIALALLAKFVLFKPKLDRPVVKNPKHNLVYLFQFGRIVGHNASPYCLKTETMLKAMGVEYKVISNINNLDKFSRHKFPVVQYNQEIVQDSNNITAFLERIMESSSKAMDHGMSESDIATASLIRSAVEDSLANILIYYRWVWEPGWQVWRRGVFENVPRFLWPIVGPIIRKKVLDQSHAMGVSRLPEAELLQRAQKILHALHMQLGKSKFLFGDRFRTVDASVFGTLSNIILFPLESPLKTLTCQYDNLVTYVKTVRDYAEAKAFSPSSSS